MNKVILIGNLVREISIKQVTSGGKSYDLVENALAIKRPYKNKNGEYEVDFINIQVWGNQANFLSQYASKGCKVSVVGSLQAREYEDRNGNKQKVWEIVCTEVELLTYKEKEEQKVETPRVVEQPTRQPIQQQRQGTFTPEDFGIKKERENVKEEVEIFDPYSDTTSNIKEDDLNF